MPGGMSDQPLPTRPTDLPTPDTIRLAVPGGGAPAAGPEWLLTGSLVDHPAAVAFMEARIAAILAGTAPAAAQTCNASIDNLAFGPIDTLSGGNIDPAQHARLMQEDAA